jgi:hypothetical protein
LKGTPGTGNKSIIEERRSKETRRDKRNISQSLALYLDLLIEADF